jgi:hypothetical protein
MGDHDMTTDPRIAALAQALQDAYMGIGFGVSAPDQQSYREAAAAILAALPPDWCGHEEHAIALARIDRWRKIKEAARALIADIPPNTRSHVPRVSVDHVLFRALRAALEAER